MTRARLSALVAFVSALACSSGGGGAAQCPAGSICMLTDTYSPSTVTVSAGSQVPFTNGSGIIHTVTFNNPRSPGVVDIPLHSSGTNSRTFTTIGRFPFHCTQHSGMTGEIVVN